jgi:predicted P-loop ATPase
MGEALAFNKEWFTDSIMLGEESKELVLSLAGKSVCEISEMGSKKADRDKIKAMLSRTHDYGRPAYGRTPIERPRRNIFLGSTNSTEPLEDPTGNRRYLPVQVTREINLAWVRANVAQLIGEACHLESAGATFDIPREAWKDAAQRQEASRKKSTAEDYIADWFDDSPLDGETYEQQAQADDQFIMVTDLTHALINACGQPGKRGDGNGAPRIRQTEDSQPGSRRTAMVLVQIQGGHTGDDVDACRA